MILAEGAGDRGKGRGELGLDRRHDGEEGQTSRCGDDAIFDGSRTRVIFHETNELVHLEFSTWNCDGRLHTRLFLQSRETRHIKAAVNSYQ